MPLQIAASRPGIRNLHQGCSRPVQTFFPDLPHLVESEFNLDIILAYMFFRLEQGQNQVLFCGARKLHKTDAELTWTALDVHHLTREGFLGLFRNIYGFELDQEARECIVPAERIRDRLMHGKEVSDPDKREAISRVLYYAERTNIQLSQTAEVALTPFTGDLRGFIGRLESLDAKTSRWILKGMGFTLQ